MIIIIPILVITFLYYLSYNQLGESTKDTYLTANPLAIYITGFLFFIIVPFFMKGYLTSTIVIKYIAGPLSLIIAGVFGYFIYSDNRFSTDYNDVKSEVVRNTLLLFMRTALPLFVFLTIFRFYNPLIQFPLAIMGIYLIYRLSKPLQEYFASTVGAWLKRFTIIRYSYTKISIVASLTLFVVGLSIITFQFPTNMLENRLNLSQHISFFSTQRESIYQTNDYRQKEIFSIDTHLVDIKRSEVSGAYYYTYSEDELVLKFEGDHSFLIPKTTKNEDRRNLIDSYEEPKVIINDENVTVEGTGYSFPTMIDVDYFYNSYDKSLYYIRQYDYTYQRHLINESTYTKIDLDGNKTENTLLFDHNREPMFIDDKVYLYDTFGHSFGIEVMDSDLELNSFFHHTYKNSFIRSKSEYGSVIINYKVVDNNIEFLQLDYDGTLSLYQLVEEDVSIELPFYSSYSIGIFFWIFLSMILPVTNFSKNFTTVSFENKIKKDKAK